MARNLWTRSAFVLLGMSVVGCKTGPNEPLRVDSLLNRPGVSTESSANAVSQASDAKFSISQSAKDYFTDSRLTTTKSQETTNLAQVSEDRIPSFRQATNAVKDALTIEPRVVKAIDPTNLAYDPGPIQPRLHLSAAAFHEQQGQLDEAAQQYERLLAIDPTNRGALVGLGRLKHRQGDLARAIEVYSFAAQHYGDDPVVLNDLGLCLARAERSSEAVTYLEKAIQLKPDSLLYRNNLAAVLVEANRSNEAVTALAQSYGPAVAHYNVGYLLRQQGDSQDATAHFMEALKINPSLQPARHMLEQLSPQIGTRPTHLQRSEPHALPRTSSVTPTANPSAQTAITSTYLSEISSPPIGSSSNAVELMGEQQSSHVAPASFSSDETTVPEFAESAEGLIRLPVSRRAMRGVTRLVPPSPVELDVEPRPGFLPIAE